MVYSCACVYLLLFKCFPGRAPLVAIDAPAVVVRETMLSATAHIHKTHHNTYVRTESLYVEDNYTPEITTAIL